MAWSLCVRQRDTLRDEGGGGSAAVPGHSASTGMPRAVLGAGALDARTSHGHAQAVAPAVRELGAAVILIGNAPVAAIAAVFLRVVHVAAWSSTMDGIIPTGSSGMA